MLVTLEKGKKGKDEHGREREGERKIQENRIKKMGNMSEEEREKGKE